MAIIVVYSHTGNNRLLAAHIGERAGVDVADVVETRRRRSMTILLDMLLRRRPAIETVAIGAERPDRLLFVAPIWNRHVAHPMQSAMRQASGRFDTCAVASLCGAERSGQADTIRNDVTANAGVAPELIIQLPVTDLSTPERPLGGVAASTYAISASDLERFAPQIDELVGWLTAS